MKKQTGERKGAWKAVVGVLLVIGAFASIKDGFGTFLVGFVLGLALLLWYFWPTLRKHLKAYQIREDGKRAEEERRRYDQEKLESEWHVCESCGARFQGTKCPYCRTPVQ